MEGDELGQAVDRQTESSPPDAMGSSPHQPHVEPFGPQPGLQDDGQEDTQITWGQTEAQLQEQLIRLVFQHAYRPTVSGGGGDSGLDGTPVRLATLSMERNRVTTLQRLLSVRTDPNVEWDQDEQVLLNEYETCCSSLLSIVGEIQLSAVDTCERIVDVLIRMIAILCKVQAVSLFDISRLAQID